MNQETDKIRFCYVARHLYKQLAWVLEDQTEMHSTEWEKYEILRDAIDGLCMALSKMQDGTFDGLGDDDFKIQADVILENELEKVRRKKKN